MKLPLKYYIYHLPAQYTLRFIGHLLMLLFLNCQIKGLENLKKFDGNYIIASNHIQEFDVVWVPSAISIRLFPQPFFFVSLPKSYYPNNIRAKILYGGFLFFLLGGYPVYKGLDDYNKSLRHHLRILDDGGVVYIFPQGRVNNGGKAARARGGLAHLSFTKKKDILPIHINGIQGMSFKAFFSRRKNMKITIGEPIRHKDLFEHDFEPTRDNLQKKAQVVLDTIFGLS